MNDTAFKVTNIGALDVNTILLPLGDTLYIIDPGGDENRLLRDIAKIPHVNTAILLTHAHFDHIGAVPALVKALPGTKVYLHPADIPLYNSPANAFLPYMPHPENLPETAWPLDEPRITVRESPGHTPGGVLYYVPELETVFAGDSIFHESIGRTDFPGGDTDTLLNSVRTQVFTLPGETVIIPGHDERTTVKHEIKYNPYFQDNPIR